MNDKIIDYHKNIIQSSNVNFLIGSGLSRPFLPTLGNIEQNIEAIEQHKGIDARVKKYVVASLLYYYFINVMYPNKCILSECGAEARVKTFQNYLDFLSTLNVLIRRRYSTIVNKQANIFTTNIDFFFEKSIEKLGMEFNDGFSGRINPTFSLSNYNKVISRCSHNFDNESRIPIINLLKVHGSLNWRYDNAKRIVCSFDDTILDTIKAVANDCKFLSIEENDNIDSIIGKVNEEDINEEKIIKFEEEYQKLPLVNPTKKKFAETTLNLYYYEMLRFLSNELEKETTVLYVVGFSMADEHIREIIIRAAKNNPTLAIFIFAYDESAMSNIKFNMNNDDYHNIKYLAPDKNAVYDFESINNLFFNAIKNSL